MTEPASLEQVFECACPLCGSTYPGYLPIHFTGFQWRIIRAIADRKGRWINLNDLIETVYMGDEPGSPDMTIRTSISKIRTKIPFIETERGRGYRWRVELNTLFDAKIRQWTADAMRRARKQDKRL